MPDIIVQNGNLSLLTNPTSTVTPLSVSRVDVGTTSAIAEISLFGAGSSGREGVVAFTTMNSGAAAGPMVERMRIHTNGNIGIGTNAPTQALEVAGTIKATAFQGNGASLTGVTDSTKVGKAGDTMTGPLSVPSLQVNGFTRSLGLAVNDSTNSGVGRGLWLWNANDPNHVIYSANPSGKSPANNPAVSGFFDTNHRLRLRTATGQGFLFENGAEVALADIDSDDGRLWTRGALHVGNSDLYFTKTDHNHTGFGNTSGYAAIENAANFDSLMILGRSTSQGRKVALWDRLDVNGELKVTGHVEVAGALHAGNSDLYFTKTDHNHTGFGNTSGYAAIENAANFDSLMILGRSTSQGRKVALWDRLDVNGDLKVTGGALMNSIGIASQTYGATQYPYETIQMHPTHNLRIWFGTKERFMFGNNGEFIIRFDQGYWAFQADGNLVKYRNDGTALWALNLVSGNWTW